MEGNIPRHDQIEHDGDAVAVGEIEAVQNVNEGGKSKTAADYISQYMEETKKRSDIIKENIELNKQTILDALKKHDVTSVRVEYYGSGDSGSIEDVDFKKGDEVIQHIHEQITYRTYQSEWAERGTHGVTSVEKSLPLDEAIKEFVYDCIEMHGHSGYENNDGGQGSLDIDVESGTFDYNHADNIVEQQHYQYDV